MDVLGAVAKADPYEGVRYLFHITHKDNIAGILDARALLRHVSAHRTRSPTDISDPDVNTRRGRKVDAVYGRPLHQGVVLDRNVEPEVLLLDGQQRMTSLFFALRSKEPVATRGDRGRKLSRHYYVDIDAALNPTADREEQGIVSVPEDRVERTDFGRRIVRDLSSRDKEVTEGMFPLDIVLDVSATKEWSLAYFAPNGAISQERFDTWKEFDQRVVDSFTHYEVPTIELAKSTAKEAVCSGFTGCPLAPPAEDTHRTSAP